MTEWTKKVSPERYLATWPMGPAAELAKQTIEARVSSAPYDTGNDVSLPDDVDPVKISKVRFFSPKSGGLSIVIEPKEWMVVRTPAGERTIQSPGKTAQFENNIFLTDDPEIIEYLTNTYSDRRFPIVREDIQTESAHRY